MPENVRALIVVLALAPFAFYLGRQVTEGTLSPREFTVWRNMWFFATVAGFLSGNFYIYAFAVVTLVLYARAEGALSPSVYVLLLFVVPPVDITVGGFGIINKLLELNNPELLAALILLPLLMSASSTENHEFNAGRLPDFLIVAYVLLMVALQFRTTGVAADSGVTNVLRVAFVYGLSILLPYFAFSRAITTTADIRKVLAVFVLAALPLCLVAVFEIAKGWHLYHAIEYALSGFFIRQSLITLLLRTSTTRDGPFVSSILQ